MCPGRSGLAGPLVLGRINMLDLAPMQAGPVRDPWFIPPSEAPERFYDFEIIVEPLVSVLMAPEREVPSYCSRLQLSACARRGVAGLGPS